MKKISLPLLLLFFVLFSQCRKETDDIGPKTTQGPGYNINVGGAVTHEVAGVVADEDGKPVSGAIVKVGNSSTRTDASGGFYIAKASVYSNHAYVKVEKSGFFLGSRSFVPSKGVNTVSIRLLSKKTAGNFQANSGGTVSTTNASVEIGPGIVKPDGGIYSGNVNVALKYIDPESKTLHEEMPGNLIGASAAGEKYLKSYGMIAVELSDDAGGRLQLAPGNPATIKVTLSQKMSTDAPTSIPLWYFDEVKGFWQHEGEATRNGNTYVGKVNHFSFWNCDYPSDMVVLSGRIVTRDKKPLSNATIMLKTVAAGMANGTSSSDGSFSGKVPAGVVFEVKVYYEGFELPVLYSIGPFSNDRTEQEIMVDVQGLVTVSGEVKLCNQTPMNDGWVYVDNKYFEVIHGEYSFVYPMNTPFNIKGYDRLSSTESDHFNYSTGNTDYRLPPIEVCQVHKFDSSSGYWLDGKKIYCERIYGDRRSLDTLELWAGTFDSVAPSYLHLRINDYKGPGKYHVMASGVDLPDEDALEINYKENPLLMMVLEADVEVWSYGLNKGDVTDISFSGLCKVWDSNSNTWIVKPITGGWIKSIRK